jgi:hypothetical protein
MGMQLRFQDSSKESLTYLTKQGFSQAKERLIPLVGAYNIATPMMARQHTLACCSIAPLKFSCCAGVVHARLPGYVGGLPKPQNHTISRS